MSKVAAEGASKVQGPATVSNVALTTDNAGIHLTGQAAAGPITVGANGDVIAGTSGGRLILRIRNLDLGPVPDAFKGQLAAAIEKQLADYAASFPLNVDRVAFRAGCIALIGTAR